MTPDDLPAGPPDERVASGPEADTPAGPAVPACGGVPVPRPPADGARSPERAAAGRPATGWSRPDGLPAAEPRAFRAPPLEPPGHADRPAASWDARPSPASGRGARGTRLRAALRRRVGSAAGGLLLAVAAGAVGGGVGAALQSHRQGGRITLRPAAAPSLDRDSDGPALAAQAALPGVVAVRTGAGGSGSGIVLDGAGHILTNAHLLDAAPAAGSGGTTRVAGPGPITVVFSTGQQHAARLVGADAGSDLAVLQVSGVSGLRPLALGDSSGVRVGNTVLAIGAPFGLQGTVTEGIVSALHRPVVAVLPSGGAGAGAGAGARDVAPAPPAASTVSYLDAIQTDAPINPGNSGGPLLDAAGRVIGITTVLRSASDGGAGSLPLSPSTQSGSIGLAFAVPMDQAVWVAEQLIDTGRAVHAALGATLDVSYVGPGARVAGAAGAARAAGLAAGDVVTALDGLPVSDADDLVAYVRGRRPGDTVTLTVRRGPTPQRTLHLRIRLTSATD